MFQYKDVFESGSPSPSVAIDFGDVIVCRNILIKMLDPKLSVVSNNDQLSV